MDLGVRTRTELLAAGIAPSTITHRCRTGRYRRLLPRVHAIGEPSAQARCHAITLWQPRAVISHRTAAFLYGWLDAPDRFEATVPSAARLRPPPWLRLYRRDLDPDEIVLGDVSACVTREQALFDCIAVMRGTALDRLVDTRIGLDVDREGMSLVCKRNANRVGAAAARHQMLLRATGFASEAERVLGRAFNERHFPLQSNVWLGGYLVDFIDDRAKVIIEVDGREFHSDPAVFRSDRRRQNYLQVRQNHLVLRYAAYDALRDPGGVADEVITVCRRRRHARRHGRR